MKAKEGEITASKMTVFFDEKDEIEKMVGEGNCRFNKRKTKRRGRNNRDISFPRP